MLLIFETCEEAGLAESIGLEKFHVRQKLSHPMDKFRRHWRASVSKNLEAAQVIRLCLGHLRQQVQHRRYEHRVSYAFVLDQLTETLRAELRKCDLARTASRRREHGGKIGNVKNRCRMQIDAAFSISHPIAEVVELRQDCGVSHHDALRPARRAAGIDEGQYCFRVINRIWTRVVRNIQGLFIEDKLPRKLHGRFRERGMPHQPSRRCIQQNSIDFSCGEPRVYRDGSNAEPTAGVYQLDVLSRIRQQKREAVARRKAGGGERSRNVPDALVEHLERNSGAVGNQRRALRVIPECPAERMKVNHRLLSNEEAPGDQRTSLMEASRRGLRRWLLWPPLHPWR